MSCEEANLRSDDGFDANVGEDLSGKLGMCAFEFLKR